MAPALDAIIASFDAKKKEELPGVPRLAVSRFHISKLHSSIKFHRKRTGPLHKVIVDPELVLTSSQSV